MKFSLGKLQILNDFHADINCVQLISYSWMQIVERLPLQAGIGIFFLNTKHTSNEIAMGPGSQRKNKS